MNKKQIVIKLTQPLTRSISPSLVGHAVPAYPLSAVFSEGKLVISENKVVVSN